MKQFISALSIAIAVCYTFSACTKNTVEETYSFYRPVYKTKEEVFANIKSHPAKPLKETGKLFIKGNYVFLNEVNKGVHIIDYSNASSPQNIGFIDIPGNIDIAVRGNTLYADCFTSLVAIDISNPANVAKTKIINSVFEHRRYGNFVADTNKIITEWQRIDTTIKGEIGDRTWMESVVFSTNSAASGSGGSAPVNGVGGSMARFALLNERLYTVGLNKLGVFNVADAANPLYIKDVNIGSWDVETIYPFKSQLFIGSQAGMYVYNVSSPDNPQFTGKFTHARVCDPVIADDNYAYVTLRSGNECAGFTNQLDVVNITDPQSPSLLKSYQLTNPHGLSKDENLLFICDGNDGLKVFNAQDANNITQIKHFTHVNTYDVIAHNGIALLVAEDGIYFYDYTNAANIRLLSKININ